MQEILDGYAKAAEPALIDAYDRLSTATIYEHVADLFPRHPSRIADVGAGTGRDAAWFAAQGHVVVAIEPVRELRDAGRQLHGSQRITWLDDHLPLLKSVGELEPFDLVTLCAVWQHLTPGDRERAIPILAGMIASGGMLIMSVRHGPGAEGRQVFPADPDLTIEQSLQVGFRLERRREAPSVQAANRAMGVSWTWLALRKEHPTLVGSESRTRAPARPGRSQHKRG